MKTYALTLLALLFTASCATAQPAADTAADAPPAEQAEGDWSVTQHTVTIAGEEVA